MSKVDFTAHAHPLLTVACPRRSAPTGAYCRRPSGHAGPFVGAHAERKALADRIHEAQGDPPIGRRPDGSWYYAHGEAFDDDDPPPPPKRRGPPRAAPAPTQGTLL